MTNPSAAERARDEYGRDLYDYNEVPPPNVGMAMWRERVTKSWPPTEANSASVHGTRYGPCVAGWVQSGEWWLHCWNCRNPQVLAALAVEAGGMEQVGWVDDRECWSWPVLYSLSADPEGAGTSLRPVYRRVEGERE